MKLVKTENGQRVLKDRSVALTPRQRTAFILFDGRNTVEHVLASTGTSGVTQEDVDHLIALGLLEQATGNASPASAPTPLASTPGVLTSVPAALAPEAAPPPAANRSSQQRYQDAYPIATRLTAKLGLKGFRLNLAVEGTTSYEQLRDLAPRIREAVGMQAYAELSHALDD